MLKEGPLNMFKFTAAAILSGAQEIWGLWRNLASPWKPIVVLIHFIKKMPHCVAFQYNSQEKNKTVIKFDYILSQEMQIRERQTRLGHKLQPDGGLRKFKHVVRPFFQHK